MVAGLVVVEDKECPPVPLADQEVNSYPAAGVAVKVAVSPSQTVALLVVNVPPVTLPLLLKFTLCEVQPGSGSPPAAR